MSLPISLLGVPTQLTSWSGTQVSPCRVVKAPHVAGIAAALEGAREHHLKVIARGAGHSYTDAALNTGALVLDVSGLDAILGWDDERGIAHVEPGVTLRQLARLTLPDGWWPYVTPSTAEATIGGCVAMNVNGKNAWRDGSFCEHVLSLRVLLASGETITLSPQSDPEFFRAVCGGAGLLGIVVAITLQLRRVPSPWVDVRVRLAASFADALAILEEEQAADFLEAWVDGFAGGCRLGRGLVTCASFRQPSFRQPSLRPGLADASRQPPASRPPGPRDRLAQRVARGIGTAWPSAVAGGARCANRLALLHGGWRRGDLPTPEPLFDSTYYPPGLLSVVRALFPHGTETFQSFIPRDQAAGLFKEIVSRSLASGFIPLWCVVKQHRADSFLLSYQVDGFSLEVNYQIDPRRADRLRELLRELMELMIAARGRFYLAKDSLLTADLYRRSIGDAAVDAFLALKRRYDPDMLLQSDLFRRVFSPSVPAASAMV